MMVWKMHVVCATGGIMKKFVFASLLLTIALSVDIARAETYRWTDDAGNMQFTDNPASVPSRFRSRLTVDEDITLENPEVRESVAECRRKAAELERLDREASRGREKERLVRENRERAEQAALKAGADRSNGGKKTAYATKQFSTTSRYVKGRPTT